MPTAQRSNSSSAEPLAVGIVGAGRITMNCHLPALQTLPGVRIAWIADRDRDRAAQIAAAASVPPAGDPETLTADIILLAIPVPGREDYLARFRQSDTGFFVEKPFANSAREHELMLDGYEDHRLGVGYQRRFHASTEFARRAIDQGWFGRLREIVHQEGNRVTAAGGTDYQDAPASGGGGITKNLACHGIDLAIFLARASHASVIDSRLELDGGTDRQVEATLELATEAEPVLLRTKVTSLSSVSNSMQLVFDNAVLSFPTQPTATVEIGRDRETMTRLDVTNVGAAWMSSQAFHLEWRAFADGYRNRRPSLVSARSSLATSKAIDAILLAGGAA